MTLSPTRILDSRDGTGQGRVQPLGPGETLSVDVHNHPGLAAAVVPGYALVNVTATDATIGGYLTMWASDRPKPFVSSLNPVPGRIVPNMVLVPVGADGRFNIFNAFGSVHVIVDMVGFVQPSAAGLFPDAVTVTANFAEAHVSWPAPQAPRSKLPDRYRVRLSNSFGTIAETTVPGDRFTAVLPNNNLGPGERIHASVAAEIDRGGSSYRSAFTHGTTVVDSSAWRPSLVRLFDGIVPVLSWPEVGVATGYDVTAVPADGGTQQSWWVGEDPDTWDASVWLTDLRPGVQYHVFVRAVNHTSTSDWTPALLVERAAAQLSGQWPLLGARTGNVFLVDPVTGDVTVIAPPSVAPVRQLRSIRLPTAVVMTPDERWIVVLSVAEGAVVVVDASTGTIARRVPVDVATSGAALVAVDGTHVLVSEVTTWVLDLTTGALEPVGQRHDGRNWYLADNALVFSGDHRVAVLSSGTAVETLAFDDGVPRVTARIDGVRRIVAGNLDGTVWLTDSCEVLNQRFEVIRQVGNCVRGATSDDGQSVYVVERGSVYNTLARVSVETGAVIDRSTAVVGISLPGTQRGGWLLFGSQLVDLRPDRPRPTPGPPPEPVRPAFGLGRTGEYFPPINGRFESGNLVIPLSAGPADPAVGFEVEAIPVDGSPTVRGSAPRIATEIRIPVTRRTMRYIVIRSVVLPNGVRVAHGVTEIWSLSA